MSLHDVDKHNDDRTSPVVNSHDEAGDVRMAHGTTSVNPKTDATTTQGYLQTKNGRLLGNDGNSNVGLFGFDSAGHMVVKVAKTGFDATTATGNDLIFNSSQDIFKVVQTDNIIIPGTGNQSPFATGSTGITVPHNLGYIPAFQAFVFVPVVAVGGQPPVSTWNQTFPTVTADSNQMTYNLQCGTDSTNIYFVDFWANNGNTCPVQAFSVTYYLFTTTA